MPRLPGPAAASAIAALGIAAVVVGSAFAHRGAEAPELTPAERAVAERKLSSFCLSCHSLDDRTWNPLVPRLDEGRWGTPQRAYDSLGRLDAVSPAMTMPFRGTEEERRALAKLLARLAAGER